MKILVTSSTGLTGRAVVKSLSAHGHHVRAMVHNDARSASMLALGATETFAGDIASQDDLRKAISGMDAIYYICPTAREDEAALGRMAVRIASEVGCVRFVYQSVLHSIEEALPHHRQKLAVERALIDSGLRYTIVCPAPFMQNILNARDLLTAEKVFAQKFFTSVGSTNRLNLLDADDLGDCVARIFSDEAFCYATLELCGPANLSVSDILADMGRCVGGEVSLRFIPDEDFAASMRARGASDYSVDTLLRMFGHYNDGDFCGSDFVATAVLGRRPVDLLSFLRRTLG